MQRIAFISVFVDIHVFELPVLELPKSFYALTDKQPGVCYSSRLAAVGEFDQTGGVLMFHDNDEIVLRIPDGALTRPQLIYMVVQYDNGHHDDLTETLSPVIECGPDGTQFQVSANIQ